MSYLEPPPAPNPVVVVKDVGGFVAEYQKRTDLYRQTNREVQLHECRSACTLALSLPNVCVFPDSLLKFHQAYNLNTRISDLGVSNQLFASYPPAVRARLGTLTRDYHVLTGTELIALGVRDCTAPRPAEPKIMVADAKPQPLPPAGSRADLSLSGLVHGVITAFDRPVLSSRPAPAPEAPAALAPPVEVVFAAAPTPLPRPHDLGPEPASPVAAMLADVPLPPRRPMSLQVAYVRRMPVIALPRVITGAQPILPTAFSAYAALGR